MDIRQEKLKKLLVSEGGNLSEKARKAGYSERYIRSGKLQKTKAFKETAKSILEQIEEKKGLMLSGITEQKIKKEGARSLSAGLRDLNHVSQLLKGLPTNSTMILSGSDPRHLQLANQLQELGYNEFFVISRGKHQDVEYPKGTNGYVEKEPKK